VTNEQGVIHTAPEHNPHIDESAVPAYRAHLVQARQKAQEDYDKTVLSLSGGALGISFAFVKDIVGSGPTASPHLLMLAWVAWGLSSACVLISFYTSHITLERAIKQIDRGEYRYQPGGKAATLTHALNALGGIAFVLGVAAIAVFVNSNLR